jgi:hypothetical protein
MTFYARCAYRVFFGSHVLSGGLLHLFSVRFWAEMYRVYPPFITLHITNSVLHLFTLAV